MERNLWVQALIILAVIAVGFYVAGEIWLLVSHFGDIIILFFLAWLVAFSLLPIIRVLEQEFPIGRAGATAIVYIALLICLALILVLVVPLLISQISQLAIQLPSLALTVPVLLREIQGTLDQWNIPINISVGAAGLGQQASQIGSRILENTVVVASSVASGLFSVTIILILSFYFALDGDRILHDLLAAVPPRYSEDARQFSVSINHSFGGFLRGTAIQAVIFGVGTAIIMLAGGLHYVLLASIFAAVVMVIPFIGPLLATVVPLVIALFSALPTTQFLVILVALVGLQVLVMNIIAPKVLSESVGLHPLLVFLALLVGAKEAGLAGAIFGVPITAVIYATAQILFRRWSVIGPPMPVAMTNGHIPQHHVRLERISAHIRDAVSRIFRERTP